MDFVTTNSEEGTISPHFAINQLLQEAKSASKEEAVDKWNRVLHAVEAAGLISSNEHIDEVDTESLPFVTVSYELAQALVADCSDMKQRHTLVKRAQVSEPLFVGREVVLINWNVGTDSKLSSSM